VRGKPALKITKERNKNKDDQHPNTPIPFKRGINTKGGKKDDFSSFSKPAAALPFPRKTYQNQLACHLSWMFEWIESYRKEWWQKTWKKKEPKGLAGIAEEGEKNQEEEKTKIIKTFPKVD